MVIYFVLTSFSNKRRFVFFNYNLIVGITLQTYIALPEFNYETRNCRLVFANWKYYFYTFNPYKIYFMAVLANSQKDWLFAEFHILV